MQHPKKEQTLVIIKPDALQRSLVGEIIGRFERIGLKLVAMKMVLPDEAFVEAHYTLDSEWRRVTGEKTIKSYKVIEIKSDKIDLNLLKKIKLKTGADSVQCIFNKRIF